MARTGSPYGHRYQLQRQALLAKHTRCRCGQRATTADHQPPLALHLHRDGSGCCQLVPSCVDCMRRQSNQVKQALARLQRLPEGEAPPDEPEGAPVDHAAWDGAPWLEELRDVPATGVWPRLMTLPHPDAVGSYGAEAVAWIERRSGRPLRWWQRLATYRLLEHDAQGALVWRTLLLSMARQLGKSWWLRELFLWRLHQAERFGEPQLVLHTGKDVAVCKEVQLPARAWARRLPLHYKVREVNGQEEIERLACGSRWMLRAKQAVYGYSASLAGIDEAWKVSAAAVEEGVVPTMAERVQAQLLLVSTAHRLATSLYPSRRDMAIERLWQPHRELLLEWSSPRTLAVDDHDGWRLASAHWSGDREEFVGARLEAATSGVTQDEDEPDPMASFETQWLDRWPLALVTGDRGEPLLDPGQVWRRDAHAPPDAPVWVAVEDNAGHGAAVAAVAALPDGGWELDGWLCDSWVDAIADADALLRARPGSRLTIGPSVAAGAAQALQRLPRRPERAGATETRTGLPLLRELIATGALTHDGAGDLAAQVSAARVREVSGGLLVVSHARSDLLRAAVWALRSAQRPVRLPRIS